MLTTLLRDYRDYDPATGEHDRQRSLREYARLLGISHPHLIQVLSGQREPGGKIIRGLLRAFPSKAAEISHAVAAEPAEVA